MSDSSLNDWLNTLSPVDREKFLNMMRDENTYVAESLDDILIVLDNLKNSN